MGSKIPSQPKPLLAGVAYLDFPTNETNQPHTYFAGSRKLNVSWITEPVITSMQPTVGTTGKK